MQDLKSLQEQSIILLSAAYELDKAEKYDQALTKYINALEILKILYKAEFNERTQQVIGAKIKECLQCAHEAKKKIQIPNQGSIVMIGGASKIVGNTSVPDIVSIPEAVPDSKKEDSEAILHPNKDLKKDHDPDIQAPDKKSEIKRAPEVKKIHTIPPPKPKFGVKRSKKPFLARPSTAIKKPEAKKLQGKKTEIPKRYPMASKGEVKKDSKKKSEESKLDPALETALQASVLTEKPNVKWSDVVGLEEAKESLKEVIIYPIQFPNIFDDENSEGILLYGPPGTGKSFLAKACATESNGMFFSISSSDLISKWMGESEKLIKTLFEMARAHTPAVIFIDEIDSMCSKQSTGDNSSTKRILNEFKVQMDGLRKEVKGLLVLGATNVPWDIDEAIRRRLKKKIYIPLPDKKSRESMFKMNFQEVENSISERDYEVFADKTDGYSGSDISNVCSEAKRYPKKKCVSAKKFKQLPNGFYIPAEPSEPGIMSSLSELGDKVRKPPLLREDVLASISKIKATVDPKDLEQYRQWTMKFGMEA